MRYEPAKGHKLTHGSKAAAGMRVVAATGGSGGHIYPALAFAEAIERRRPDSSVFYTIGSRPIEGEIMRSVPGERAFRLRARPIFFLSDFAYAKDLLGSLRPDAVVGFGGYASVPTVLAARALGIPVLIHEQNAVTGLANRALAPFATRVAVTFPSSGRSGQKTVRTGMPLRTTLRTVSRDAALGALGLDRGRRTLLVCGGSQGARALNEAVREFVREAPPAFVRGWQVVHLSGAAGFEAEKSFYAGVSVPYRLFSFYEDMSIIYSGADVVLSRAGSVTLHELAFFGKCAALVPYPGARAHQADNAGFLASNGAASVIPQAELTPARVAALVEEAEKSLEFVRGTGERLKALLKTDGAAALAEEVIKMAVEHSR